MSAAAVPITIVMNASAGRGDGAERLGDIERALADCGREVRIVRPPHAGALTSLVKEVVEEAGRRPQLIVAAGGDGTVNTVVQHIKGTGMPMGVIPIGTFNYFARDLGIPLDPVAAARALLDGVVKRTHVATVNGRVFLINASFGLWRRLQEEREAAKRRYGRSRPIVVISALLTLLREHRTYAVRLELDGEPLVLGTQMVLFGFNRLQLEKLALDVARCPSAGLIAVLVLRPMRRFELLGFALRGALQGLDDPANLRSHCASRVDVHWPGGRRIRVAIDGESMECRLPLRFEVEREALAVLVPREPVPRE